MKFYNSDQSYCRLGGQEGANVQLPFTAKKTPALEADNREWAANRKWKQTKLLLFPHRSNIRPKRIRRTIIRSNPFRFNPPFLLVLFSFESELKRVLQIIAIVFEFQPNQIVCSQN